MWCFVDRCLSFSTFSLAIALYARQFTDSDYPFCIFKLFLQFLNHAVSKVLIRQARVTLGDVGYHVLALEFPSSERLLIYSAFIYVGFELMKIIPEMRCAHLM